jgi:hypothetical protein
MSVKPCTRFRRVTGKSRLCVLAVELGLALVAGAAHVGWAADPFYDSLLRKGVEAFNRHDYKTATKALRLACFGMLDEPEALANCLVDLGLAQAAVGDKDGFADTFHRLAEVEERFSAYASAQIPVGAREEYERLLLATVPKATLAASPHFSHILQKPTPTRTPAKKR